MNILYAVKIPVISFMFIITYNKVTTAAGVFTSYLVLKYTYILFFYVEHCHHLFFGDPEPTCLDITCFQFQSLSHTCSGLACLAELQE